MIHTWTSFISSLYKRYPKFQQLVQFLMYTDDTTLYCCLEDIDSVKAEQILNDKLQYVHIWLSA